MMGRNTWFALVALAAIACGEEERPISSPASTPSTSFEQALPPLDSDWPEPLDTGDAA
jgi:hypothetical protein